MGSETGNRKAKKPATRRRVGARPKWSFHVTVFLLYGARVSRVSGSVDRRLLPSQNFTILPFPISNSQQERSASRFPSHPSHYFPPTESLQFLILNKRWGHFSLPSLSFNRLTSNLLLVHTPILPPSSNSSHVHIDHLG